MLLGRPPKRSLTGIAERTFRGITKVYRNPGNRSRFAPQRIRQRRRYSSGATPSIDLKRRANPECDIATAEMQPYTTDRFRPRLCKNSFERDRYSKPD